MSSTEHSLNPRADYPITLQLSGDVVSIDHKARKVTISLDQDLPGFDHRVVTGNLEVPFQHYSQLGAYLSVLRYLSMGENNIKFESQLCEGGLYILALNIKGSMLTRWNDAMQSVARDLL